MRALAVLAVAALSLGGCANGAAAGHGGRPRGERAASAAPVPTGTARIATVRGSTVISGIVAPFQNVAVTSSLAEAATAVDVLAGDRVRRGEVLATLDTADLQAQLAQAQGVVDADLRNADSADAKAAQTRYTARLNIGTGANQVRSAQAALAQASRTLANDRANLLRDRSLVASGYIAQQALDQQSTIVANDAAALRGAQANLRTAVVNEEVNGDARSGLQQSAVAASVADAGAARAVIEQARAQVRQLRTQIAKATIVAPVDGVVTNRNLNPGEYPGSRTLFTVQQLDRVYANLNASGRDTFAIPRGAPASIAVAGTSATYRGRVAAVLGQVTPGSTDFTVQVVLANPDGRLQAGLPVTGTIALPAVHGVAVPTTAFLDDTHTSVLVAEDELTDTTVRTVRVSERGTDGTTSIVGGLRSGETIVLNGQLGLTDGQSIAQ